MAYTDFPSIGARPDMETDQTKNEDLPLPPEVLELIDQLIDERRRQFLELQRLCTKSRGRTLEVVVRL